MRCVLLFRSISVVQSVCLHCHPVEGWVRHYQWLDTVSIDHNVTVYYVLTVIVEDWPSQCNTQCNIFRLFRACSQFLIEYNSEMQQMQYAAIIAINLLSNHEHTSDSNQSWSFATAVGSIYPWSVLFHEYFWQPGLLVCVSCIRQPFLITQRASSQHWCWREAVSAALNCALKCVCRSHLKPR